MNLDLFARTIQRDRDAAHRGEAAVAQARPPSTPRTSSTQRHPRDAGGSAQ